MDGLRLAIPPDRLAQIRIGAVPLNNFPGDIGHERTSLHRHLPGVVNQHQAPGPGVHHGAGTAP